MRSIEVPLGDRSYPVLVGAGILGRRATWEGLSCGAATVVVSNEVVAPLYMEKILPVLGDTEVHTLVLPDGEFSKTIDNWKRILDFLADIGAGRDTCLIALGGGVIGDLCGFAASTWMRGVPFVQVPTTLLAQVDAAVGGKTGVNHPRGKNLVGTFHQPVGVIADISTLDTLPEREYLAGLAEVAKYGAICDQELLDWLEHHAEALLGRDEDAVLHVVTRSVGHKADIVARDEREGGLRAILNFGHSFAHALEALTGYGRYLHGEAVAVGMVIAAGLSERRGLCEAGLAPRMSRLLSALGLPVGLPADIATDDLIAHMRLDKKNLAGRRRLVLLDRPGHAVVDADSTDADIRGAIEACRVNGE